MQIVDERGGAGSRSGSRSGEGGGGEGGGGSEGGMGVKASGGVRSLRDAVRMLEAGATRIGTSAGVWIMREATEEEGKRGKVDVDEAGEWKGKLGITRLYSDD